MTSAWLWGHHVVQTAAMRGRRPAEVAAAAALAERESRGVEVDEVLTRFLHQTPSRLKVATSGPMGFNSVLMEIDETTGKATYISREDRQLV